MNEGLSFEELESAAKQTETATPDAPPAETTQATPEQSKPQFTDSDVEAYRQLSELGINPQNAKEFIAAKSALDNLPAVLQSPNGRRTLLDEIQKNDPRTYKALLEDLSDRWYSELPEDVKKGTSGDGTLSRSATSAPDPRIDALSAKLEELVREKETQVQQARQQSITDGYQKSVDGLIGKLPDGVSDRDKDYIRLKTNELIWKDEAARNRVAKGNYTDVPSYISKASAFVTAETKAASNAERERREGVISRGVKEIPAAAENVNGSTAHKEQGHGYDPVWGDITPGEVKSAYTGR